MALSDGRDLDMPPLLSRGEERRLRKLQRQSGRQRAARMQGTPMSARELKTYHQIGALRARQARRRKDWLHKVTTALAKNHGMLVVEDLHVRRLTSSARGTVEVPGRNVKAKAGLNRSILGMAWGKAGHMLSSMAAFLSACPPRIRHRPALTVVWWRQTADGAETGSAVSPADTRLQRIPMQRGSFSREDLRP